MSTLVKRNGDRRSRSLYPSSSLLRDFFDSDWPVFGWAGNNGDGEGWIPAANVKENENSYIVELSTPGYSKQDIQVEVDANNVLHIRGEHREESKDKDKNYTRQEFSYGTFSRSFSLPDTVNEEGISAKCHDGVLEISIPKKEMTVQKRKNKEIKID